MRIGILVVSASFIGIASAAAQAPMQTPPQDPTGELMREWGAYINEQGHVVERLNAYLTSMGQARAQAELKEKYWKDWCGDVPGCAVGGGGGIAKK